MNERLYIRYADGSVENAYISRTHGVDWKYYLPRNKTKTITWAVIEAYLYHEKQVKPHLKIPVDFMAYGKIIPVETILSPVAADIEDTDFYNYGMFWAIGTCTPKKRVRPSMQEVEELDFMMVDAWRG